MLNHKADSPIFVSSRYKIELQTHLPRRTIVPVLAGREYNWCLKEIGAYVRISVGISSYSRSPNSASDIQGASIQVFLDTQDLIYPPPPSTPQITIAILPILLNTN